MRPINTHSSPAVIPGSTASTETKKATDKKQQQNLNQTMPCTADGEQKSEAVKGERELSSTMDY